MASSPVEVPDVARIATEAAAKYPGLEVLGVSVTNGSDYAEIFVRLRGCGAEPCLATLGVFRDMNEADLLPEISARLGQHVRDHQG
jgi:hypothetical protein